MSFFFIIFFFMILSFEQCGSIIEEQLNLLSIGSRTPAGLYEPIDYVMAAGGKRVRPALALMACNIFIDDIEKALKPALALEIFHNFTLLHDDLMDNAVVRRNRPTVHKRWNNNTAILSGDAMMILAYRHMNSAHQDILHELIDTLNCAALQVCEGQQYDMDFERRANVTIPEYLNMIRLKTAVLLAACLKAGAICGGANSENVETLYRFGISLGMSFQIQDDWLDLYADPDVFGKAIGGDVISGKKTFLLITALEKADEKTRKELYELIDDKKIAANKKINAVKNIYARLEVSDAAQKAAAEYYQQAMKHLRDVNIPDKSRIASMEMFVEKLLRREK